MTVRIYEGVVASCDRDRIREPYGPGRVYYCAYQGPWIGDHLVAYEIEAEFDHARVWVGLADETFIGELEACSGVRGWSDWTPAEMSYLKLGGHDLVQILEAHDGKPVKLVISDEGPVNPLDLRAHE